MDYVFIGKHGIIFFLHIKGTAEDPMLTRDISTTLRIETEKVIVFPRTYERYRNGYEEIKSWY